MAAGMGDISTDIDVWKPATIVALTLRDISKVGNPWATVSIEISTAAYNATVPALRFRTACANPIAGTEKSKTILFSANLATARKANGPGLSGHDEIIMRLPSL